MEPSIFLDFNLPNAATWFYFSLLLSVSIFFQFSRPFSIRNLDLLALFLLVPGFLLLQESRARGDSGEQLFGYSWLLAGSLYWFVRAIFDLTLVRRPVADPNLNTSGLSCLGIALFLCLGAVAFRGTGETSVHAPVGTKPKAIEQLQDTATAAVEKTQEEVGRPTAEVRFWVERTLALICHAAVAVGLLMIGWRQFGELSAGVALGTLYVLLPYTAYHVGQFHLVWPAAFVTWAVFCYRRPLLSGWLLGLAAGSAFVTLLLFPLWLGFYWRRGAVRFATSFGVALLLSVGVLAVVLWSDGWLTSGLTAANVAEWLPWKRPQAESLWTGVHGAYRLPIFVLFVGFVGVITVWPSPKNLSHLVALSAAVLLGVQFWHADRGGVYVLWYLPLVLLMVFRPNLTGHEPPPIEPGGVFQWAGAAWERVRGKKPAPATSNDLAV
ncbi:MAG: hypothetical protein U0791_02080 [Gemmataceae bacterium]